MKKQIYILVFIGGIMIATYSNNYAINESETEQINRYSHQSDSLPCSPSLIDEVLLTISCKTTVHGVQITGHLQDSRTHLPIAGTIKRADGSILNTTPQGWFGFTGKQWEWIFFEVDGYQTTGRQIVTSKSAYWIIRMNKN